MKLSLQLILETLTEYGAQLIETDGDFAFTGVQILTSPTDILEPDTLYVCTPKVLPKLKKQLFENHCFVFKAKPSQLQCHHALHGILLDENTDLNEVVNRLITLFTQFHAFEFAIKEASLERRGYEPFFEIAKKAFPHCLIVVTDSAYNIVCSTRSSVDDIPYFRDLLQRGYYSREDMNQIASWGYYEDERKCVQPVLYPAEKTICGYPFLVRSYKNHGAAYCFIGCYFLDVPPTQRDISLYTCLTQELENYYKVNGIFDAGMLGKQQQLLDDLIRPKQNSPEYFHDRCAQLNIPYQGTFRIGLVQCESSTLFKVSHISNQLRAHCPLANYGVFQYGSSVIILFRDWNDANVRTQSGFSEDWNALLTTLRQNKACMGISLLFSDVTKLYVGYRQAEAASNIGKRRDTDGVAYFYSKYYLEDMLEHYADTMPLEDTYATSYTLAQAVRALGGFDLILCGRQAIDGDTAQVGPMLAEHLGLPQLTCACAITIEDGAIRIRQEGERAYRVLRAPLPAVVTVVKAINEPRLPNVMRKLQANRMQPQTLTADDLPALDPDCIGLHGSPTKVSRTFVPVRTKQTVRIDGAQPEAAVVSLLAQLDAAHISLEGGGDHV